jgi:hypothetical protein
MGFHETEHGMTHEDIVPLVDRVASRLATEQGLAPDRAATLAHKMLHELTGDVRSDLNAFLWAGAPRSWNTPWTPSPALPCSCPPARVPRRG